MIIRWLTMERIGTHSTVSLEALLASRKSMQLLLVDILKLSSKDITQLSLPMDKLDQEKLSLCLDS